MYKYARTRTVALVISAIALAVIAVFSVRSWQEERNQACSAQWLAYNTTANTVKNLGGTADIDKVLGKLRDFAERCLPEGTENNS